MKLGTVKTIQREELSKFGELPGWMNSFLQTLNQFISQATQALKGNLTFEDNFLCTVKKLTFVHGTELSINPNSKLRVVGVIPVSANGAIIDKWGFRQLSDGSIGMTFYFNSGTEAICTVVILLG